MTEKNTTKKFGVDQTFKKAEFIKMKVADAKNDLRYPYTYASDFIRSIPKMTPNGTKLNRSEASEICSKIAEILGISDYELAEKLADYYLRYREEITNKSVDDFVKIYMSKESEE